MSVATEIERIQTAKETLKTKLNAKNDSEHQITNELISDYGNFVDSITGGVNLDDYFTNNITSGNSSAPGFISTIKKLKSPLTITGNNCSYMFAYASLEEIPIMDTSNVTNMERMFYNSNIKTLDLSNFNTSNVTDMTEMFDNCQATTLNVSNFNTSKVTYMSSMFSGSQATTLDLSSFDTSKVIYMSTMLWNSKATTIDLSSFNTSNVTDMNGMFNSSKATILDLSSFDTSKVTDMSNMFADCMLLTTLDIRNFDFTNVTSYTDMFFGVPSNCKIIVKDDTAKEWITSKFTNLTNVVTVAELETK